MDGFQSDGFQLLGATSSVAARDSRLFPICCKTLEGLSERVDIEMSLFLNVNRIKRTIFLKRSVMFPKTMHALNPHSRGRFYKDLLTVSRKCL